MHLDFSQYETLEMHYRKGLYNKYWTSQTPKITATGNVAYDKLKDRLYRYLILELGICSPGFFFPFLFLV